MGRARRFGLLSVWATYASYGLLYFAGVLASSGGRLMLTPGGRYWDMGAAGKLLFISAKALFANSPDLASMYIFLKIRRHYKSVHPTPPPPAQEDQGGGGVHPVGLFAEEDAPADNEEQSQDQGEEVSRIVRILRLHVATSLLDVLANGAFFLPGDSRVFAIVFLLMVLTYWVPLLVIKANFTQMDKMAETFCLLVC